MNKDETFVKDYLIQIEWLDSFDLNQNIIIFKCNKGIQIGITIHRCNNVCRINHSGCSTKFVSLMHPHEDL